MNSNKGAIFETRILTPPAIISVIFLLFDFKSERDYIKNQQQGKNIRGILFNLRRIIDQQW